MNAAIPPQGSQKPVERAQRISIIFRQGRERQARLPSRVEKKGRNTLDQKPPTLTM
jgi:hypothetical protein